MQVVIKPQGEEPVKNGTNGEGPRPERDEQAFWDGEWRNKDGG